MMTAACEVLDEEAPLVIAGTRAPTAFREDAYLEPIAQVTPRIMAAVGATWGACFFFLMMLIDASHLVSLAAFSVAGGTTFGMVWGSWFSWYVKRFHRNLLKRPADYFAPQPMLESEGPVLEVLGNQRVGRLFVGGKMVLTERALWFIPHNRNGRAFRTPTRLALADITDLEILPRGALETWLTGARPDLFPGRLRLTTTHCVQEFNVGTREMVAALIERLTKKLPAARQVELSLESGSLDLACREAVAC